MDNTVEHQQALNPEAGEVRKQDRKLQWTSSRAPPQWSEYEQVYRILAPRFTKSVPEPTWNGESTERQASGQVTGAVP
jgi:hypothetical protein